VPRPVPYVHPTVDGLPAEVGSDAENVVIAEVPMLAPMVVASPAWLLGLNEVVALLATVPATVLPEVGESVAVKPVDGAVVTEKTIGTPTWLVLKVAVTVTGEPPAVKADSLKVTDVMVVPVATEYITATGPAYAAGDDAASMMDVVNVPVGAGLVAGEATGVTVPPTSVALKPGGNDPVHWNADVVAGPAVASGALQVGSTVKVHPVGAMIVTLVIAYAFDAGLVSLKLTAVAPPASMAFGVVVRVGRLAFCVACTGTASGTRNSIPDCASKASIVPELNLLKYIDDVFIIFRAGRSESVYKEGGRIVYNSGSSRAKRGHFGLRSYAEA